MCPRMINVGVQHNGGFLPDIILLTQSYYHRGTRFNAMKRFRLCSLSFYLNVLTFSSLTGGCSEDIDAFIFFINKGCSEGLDAFIFFFKQQLP